MKHLLLLAFMSIMLILLSGYASAALNTTGLISWFSFDVDDSASGSIRNEQLNTNLYGNEKNTLIYDSSCKLQGCYNFTTGGIVLPQTYWSSTSQNKSIAFWFNADAITTSRALYYGEITSGKIEFTYGASNINFYANDGSWRVVNYVDEYAKAWTHAVFVYQNATNITLYINGTLYGNSSIGNLAGGAHANASIGSLFDGTIPFTGRIDEFSFWNRTLDGNDVSNLYNSGAGYSPYTILVMPVITLSVPSNNTLNQSNIQPLVYNVDSNDYSNNVTNCSLWENSTGTWSFRTQNQTALKEGNNNLTGLSFSDSRFIWGITCSMTNGSILYSATNNTLRIDNSTPTITWAYPVNNQVTNNSYFPMNINISDTYLERSNFTIYNSSLNILYTNQSTGITSTSYNYSNNNTFSYDDNYMIDVCGGDSLTYSPDKPFYRSVKHSESIDFIDYETNNDITMTISVHNPKGNPVSLNGRNLILNTSEDGKHIKFSGSVQLNNNQETIKMVYHSNNPFISLLPKNRKPAHFITSDYNLYFHHEDLVNSGWSIVENGMEGNDYYIYITKGQSGYLNFDPITGGLHNYCENRTLIVDFQSPTISFNHTNPSSINITDIKVSGLNLTYNMSDRHINTANLSIYYKINSSTSDISYYINGTSYSGYHSNNYILNTSVAYTYSLDSYDVMPATYNFNESWIGSNIHAEIMELNTTSQFLKIKIYNISNSSQFGFFELMANKTNISGGIQTLFCNSSYAASTLSPSTNSNCIILPLIKNSSTPDHTHSTYSYHHIIPFAINTTTGKIGSVAVTNTGYLLIRGESSNHVRVHSVYNTTDGTLVQLTTDNGVIYISKDIAPDANLHQFNLNTSTTSTQYLTHYACASDYYNHTNCTSPKTDAIILEIIPPSGLEYSFPTSRWYNDTFNINYTQPLSPNNKEIARYNISIMYANMTIERSIILNNSPNLNYSYNATYLNETNITGSYSQGYYIKIGVCDSSNYCSDFLSPNFYVDHTKPNIVEPSILLDINPPYTTKVTRVYGMGVPE